MDRLIYVAMSGAQQLLNQQAVTAHNLANVSTAGYKADTSAFRVAPVSGPGLATRAYALDTTPGANLAPGAIENTGNPLDAAIEGNGFFAVQTPDGNEAYTRSGGFEVSAEGTLQTHGGLAVLSDGGPISVPAGSTLSFGRDGTISVTISGQSAANVQVIGKLKLVNPAANEVVKGRDGLFRMAGGDSADADETVAVTGGALEASNVSAVATMIEMISLSRQFDLAMKMLQNAENDAQRATQLLSTNPA